MAEALIQKDRLLVSRTNKLQRASAPTESIVNLSRGPSRGRPPACMRSAEVCPIRPTAERKTEKLVGDRVVAGSHPASLILPRSHQAKRNSGAAKPGKNTMRS